MKAWIGLSALALAACDSGTGSKPAADNAPQSRVQAVIAKGETATSSATTSAQKAATEAPAKRVPLCQSQLAAAGQAFNPKTTPQRRAAQSTDLPEQPLLKDQRWTWVNFWAAWCVPCKQELPLLFDWQKRLDAKLHFAFVSLDDDERQLQQFLQDQPASGLKQSYWLPDGPVRMAWLQALGLTSEPELPMQLLIDPQGKLRCRIEGAVEPADFADLQAIVTQR